MFVSPTDRGVHDAVLLDPALGWPPLQLLPRVHAAAGAPPLPQPRVQVQQRQEGRHRLLALPNTHRCVRGHPGEEMYPFLALKYILFLFYFRNHGGDPLDHDVRHIHLRPPESSR